MLTVLLLCVLGGSAVGFLNGLMGVGGAFIIIPLLDILLILLGVDPAMAHVMAVGTSPATILFTCISGALAHHKLGSIRMDLLVRMAPCLFVGGIAGAFLAPLVPTGLLKFLFGFIITLMSVYNLFLRKRFEREKEDVIFLEPVSLFFGCLSSMSGIAGTFVNIVYLNWRGVPWTPAVGTGAGVGAVIAFTATVGYVASGWNEPSLPAWSLGYVYLPGLLCLIIPSMIMAKVGALAAHWQRMPVESMKKVFFWIIIGAGSYTMIKAIL